MMALVLHQHSCNDFAPSMGNVAGQGSYNPIAYNFCLTHWRMGAGNDKMANQCGSGSE
jgi:hypothetical protein